MLEGISWASHAPSAPVEHVRVDHRCPDVLVPEKFLDSPYIVTVATPSVIQTHISWNFNSSS